MRLRNGEAVFVTRPSSFVLAIAARRRPSHDATPQCSVRIHGAHLPSRAQVRRWALAAHALNAGAGDGVVTIRYVDERKAAR